MRSELHVDLIIIVHSNVRSFIHSFIHSFESINDINIVDVVLK